VPLRSHGSLSFNRRLMAAGLVDRVQLTIFPVISGRTGAEPVFDGAADFDLELLTSRTLDRRTQELPYRQPPTDLPDPQMPQLVRVSVDVVLHGEDRVQSPPPVHAFERCQDARHVLHRASEDLPGWW
jgi:hypothetical protein